MSQAIACGALLMTIGFAVTRPRLSPSWQVGPGQAATAGVLVLLIFGVVQLNDILVAAGGLWRSFIVIVSIMIMTSAAERIGLLDKIANIVLCGPNLSIGQMFSRVFFLSALTSSILNNDAMVLLLTPLVLLHMQRIYPGRENVHRIFAFAVFAAVGVAPFVISNPMNMIVADFAGIHFNQYFNWMAPLSLIGWIITFIALRIIFWRTISLPLTANLPTQSRPEFTRAQLGMLVLLGVTIMAYPITASVDGSLIWLAALGGAMSALLLCTSGSRKGLKSILVHGVAWNIIIFLLGVFIIAIGLQNVGFVAWLASVYKDAEIITIGICSALGSALINNHPMAVLNLLAIESVPDAGRRELFSILVGGDLGPRLLPTGSLAGLIWLEGCRKCGVKISLRQFIGIGIAVTVPTLLISLLILQMR